MSTDLRHAARDYVALRRALGYQLRGYDRLLDDLSPTSSAPGRRR